MHKTNTHEGVLIRQLQHMHEKKKSSNIFATSHSNGIAREFG